jgi:hypothetical protein
MSILSAYDLYSQSADCVSGTAKIGRLYWLQPGSGCYSWFWQHSLSSRPVTLFLEMIVSLGAGILAAWLHRREQPLAPRYVRMGTLAGFYLPLTTAVAITLIALAAGLASLGTLLPLMIPYFVFLPVELGVCSLLGAFGAWLFKLFVRG